MLIKRSHAEALRYCSKGLRHWCKQNNISYLEFVKVGIDEEILASFNDTMVDRLIEAAKKAESE